MFRKTGLGANVTHETSHMEPPHTKLSSTVPEFGRSFRLQTDFRFSIRVWAKI